MTIQKNCLTPAVPGISMLWVTPQAEVEMPEITQIYNVFDEPPTLLGDEMSPIIGNNKAQNYTETDIPSKSNNLYSITINMAIDDNDNNVVNGLDALVDKLLFVVFMDRKGKMRIVPNAMLKANNASGEDAVGIGSSLIITAMLDMPFYYYNGPYTIHNDNTLSFD